MKKYIAIWHQEGGCDYTIGCGIAVRLFEAADLDAAKTHVIEHLSDPELSNEIADSLTKVDIYETVGICSVLTSNVWKVQRQRKRAEAELALLEDKERAEYDRLKKKFER